MSQKLNSMTTAQIVRSVIWNQPVCQKKTLIGCSVGISFTRMGVDHHGSPPRLATIVAFGQVGAALVALSHPRVPAGTIRQLSSDLISITRPSARSTCSPNTMPAKEKEFTALTARTCRPGDISGVRL